MLTRRDWVSIFIIGLFMFPMLAGLYLHNATTGLFGVGGLLGMIAGLVLRD